jgi:hypothetical protein
LKALSENEPIILEPCGAFGRRYRYDAVLVRRLRVLATVLTWFGVAAAVALVLLSYTRRLDPHLAVWAFGVVGITLDLFRMLGVLLICRRARPWRAEEAEGGLLGGRSIAFNFGATSGGMVFIMLTFELLVLSLAWGMLLFRILVWGLVLALMFLHGMVYAMAYSDQKWRRL